MPVRFIIDPDLPPEIRTVTLSYTFYKNDALSTRLAPASVPADAHAAP